MVNSNLAYKTDATPEPEVIIDESPLKWCSVSLSDVVSQGKRLEATAFDVVAIESANVIRQCKYGYHKLTDDDQISSAVHAPRFKRNYVEKNHPDAIGFLGSSEMLDVKPTATKFICKSLAHKLDLYADIGTVLLSCSGTMGNVSYIGKSQLPFSYSQHIIKIICRENSGYIYTCLKHSLIHRQILSLVYGAVIQEIEPEHLSGVIIPNAPGEIKKKINDLIVSSYELRDESNELIDKATALLKAELQLPDINAFDVELYKKKAPVDTFSVKLSDMSGRLDASYHVPIVDALTEHLKKYAEEVTTVGDARISKNIILAGIFKRTYVDEEYGYPFLGGKEITQLSPVTEKFLSKTIHKQRYEKELKVEENTILVTDRGSIGITAMVPKHWNGYAVSQNVLKVIPASNAIAGYLYIYLNSEFGHTLICRQTYGSVVDMIDSNSLSDVEIPLLKNHEIQKQINDLALEANQKRYEADHLEQEALKIMDAEVIYAK